MMMLSFQNHLLPTLVLFIFASSLLVSCGSSEPASTPETPGPETGQTVLTETEHDADFAPATNEIPETGEAIELVPVPGGTFSMIDEDSGNRYEVAVDSFWIGKFEITWDQYNLFAQGDLNELRNEFYKVMYDVDINMDADAYSSPSLTDEVLEMLREADVPADVISKPSPAYSDMTSGMGTDGFPAISMTHYAAHMFTKWLTIKTGDFYRLPTEAEWEYACRAGSNDDYSAPSGSNLDRQAWHRGNSNRKYQPVASKEPNALGVYNMLGNVTEWTLDQYHENYFAELDAEPAQNPWFKPTELYPRTVRGGSWTEPAETASCLQRRGSQPNWKMNDPQLPKSLWWHTNAPFVGFRVVMPKDQPEDLDEMEKYWIEAMQDYF